MFNFSFLLTHVKKHLGLLLLLLRVPLKGLRLDYRHQPEKMLWAGHLLILLTNPILQMSERNVHSQGFVGQHITDPQLSSSTTRLYPIITFSRISLEIIPSSSCLSPTLEPLWVFWPQFGILHHADMDVQGGLGQLVGGLSKDSKVKVREGEEMGPS